MTQRNVAVPIMLIVGVHHLADVVMFSFILYLSSRDDATRRLVYTVVNYEGPAMKNRQLKL